MIMIWDEDLVFGIGVRNWHSDFRSLGMGRQFGMQTLYKMDHSVIRLIQVLS
jgi:hypothetical protein